MIDWMKKIPKFVIGLISLFTVIITFVVLLRENLHLGILVFATLALLLILILSFFILFSKSPPLIIGGKGVFRFGKYRPLASIGIALVFLIVFSSLSMQPSQNFLISAIAGETIPSSTATPAPTPTPSSTATPAPTPTPFSTAIPTPTATPIPTYLEISQVLLSSSNANYRFEITISNPLMSEALVKHITLSLSQPNATCTPGPSDFPVTQYQINDTVILQSRNGSDLTFDGYVYASSDNEYSYKATGSSFDEDCSYKSIKIEFDCSFIIPPKQFSYLYLIIPRTLKITDTEGEFDTTFFFWTGYATNISVTLDLLEQSDIEFSEMIYIE